MKAPKRIAVVGAGISGLAAARQLVQLGCSPVVIEAADTTGGKLQGSPFAGLDAVDEAADMFLTRVPWALDFARDLGLIGELVAPSTGTAYIWRNERFHRLPDGLVLGVPAGFTGLALSRLLSVRAKLRAAADVMLPASSVDDDDLGHLIASRFGDEVLDQLVDPLLGGINAGDARQLSLSASAPQLAAASGAGRSMLLSLRSQRRRNRLDGPVFLAPRGGMATFAARATQSLTSAGVPIHLATSVRSIMVEGDTVRLEASRELDGGNRFDGAVLAVPAWAASTLLSSAAPDAARMLNDIHYAGVVLVSAHLDAATARRLPNGSGYLVPKPQQQQLTAVSFTSRKWPHLRPPGGGEVARISLGRFGNDAIVDAHDDQITETAISEMARHCGAEPTFEELRITRWPRGFPQYLPHHSRRVDALSHAVGAATAGRIVLVGAGYRGIGVPACIRDGQNGSAALVQHLGTLQD